MSSVGDWDPAISNYDNLMYRYYGQNSLENLIWVPENSIDPKPHLATSWVYEYWLEENNSKGFVNRGGIKAINITLRNGVTFQDGSNWNATVAKWNIDRLFIISGNLTGNGDRRNARLFWRSVEENKAYFTLNWNMSKYDADGMTFTPDQYSGYIIDENSTIFNPTPYGGTEPVIGFHLHYAPYDMYPIVKQVKVIENNQYGGEIRVEFNDWNTKGILSLNYPMLSYHSYRHNYTTSGIYGYDNILSDPRNAGSLSHMIGTGPYIFMEHIETGTPPGGYMLKNEKYWNITNLEAEGWFSIDRLEIINFPSGQLGEDALNTAMLTHAIDYVIDGSGYFSLDYDAVISRANIAYIELGFSQDITQITLNCINETWWAWPWADEWRKDFYSQAGDKSAGGIPRALRKAIGYAFDYDLMINNILDDRAIRAGGVLGAANTYYNNSISLINHNITHAREILLTTENDSSGAVYNSGNLNQSYYPNPDLYNFSKMCSDRGLTSSSSDQDWQDIADNNPIFLLNLYWDFTHEDVKNVLLSSLRDIGCGLTDKLGLTNRVTNMSDIIRNGHCETFDENYSIWSANAWVMDYHISATIPESFMEENYRDPNCGSWRTATWTPATDPNFNWLPFWNFEFCYDEDIDNWLERVWFSNMTGKAKWFNKITYKIQNELCPMIYISQRIKASVLWKDWRFNFNRGPNFFVNFDYVACC
ncbi:MAG: hypothetical protein FK730_16365 [Asgard group archaeon]|nr:hypothetical protein [Asgard group archaeon]